MKLKQIENPEHIDIRFSPEILEPGARGYLIVTFNAGKNNYYGYKAERLNLVWITPTLETGGNIVVSSTLLEDFSRLSDAELKNAPKIIFKDETIDFGRIAKNSETKVIFNFENRGGRDLIIRNIRTNNDIRLGSFDEITKPGDSGKIEIYAEGKVASKYYARQLDVISNDPQRFSVKLKVKGVIE